MNLNDVLKRPVITEKMSQLGEKLQRYGFIVDRRANKVEIRNAVEKFYGVTVKEVRTLTTPGKTKTRATKTGASRGQTQAEKKAIITLATGETINFYSNV